MTFLNDVKIMASKVNFLCHYSSRPLFLQVLAPLPQFYQSGSPMATTECRGCCLT